MVPINNIISSFLFALTFAGLLLALYAYSRSASQSGAGLLTLLSIAASFYSFGYALELFSGDPEWTYFCIKIEYLGLAFIPFLTVRLAVLFTEMGKTAKYLTSVFLITGLTTLFAVYTNNSFHLYYSEIGTSYSAPFPMVELYKAPLYYLHLGSMVFANFLSAVIYLVKFFKTKKFTDTRLLILFSSTLSPAIVSILMFLKLTPWGLDFGIVATLITCVILYIGIAQTGLLDLEHITSELVFSAMSEGVIFTTKDMKILKFNYAAKEIFPNLGRQSKKRVVFEILPDASEYLPDIDESKSFVKEKIIYKVRNIPIRTSLNKIIGFSYFFSDITQEKKRLDNLKKEAETDGLTKLRNRKSWLERANEILNQAQLLKSPCGFLMIDIDHFKKFNDNHGHEVGDTVLKSVALTIDNSLRGDDISGRYGGEEFCVCLPNTTKEKTIAVAERLRKAVKNLAILKELKESITVSVGAAIFEDFETMSDFLDNDNSAEHFLNIADKALYKSKNTGRNKVTFCSD